MKGLDMVFHDQSLSSKSRDFYSRRDLERAPLVHPELLLQSSTRGKASEKMLRKAPRCNTCQSTNLVLFPQCRFCDDIKVLDKPTTDLKRMGHHMIKNNPDISATELLDNLVGFLLKTSKTTTLKTGKPDSIVEEEIELPAVVETPSSIISPSPLVEAATTTTAITTMDEDEDENDREDIPYAPNLMNDDQEITSDLVYRFQKAMAKGKAPGPQLEEALIRYIMKLFFTPSSSLSRDQKLDEQDIILELLKAMMICDVEELFKMYSEWLDAASNERSFNTRAPYSTTGSECSLDCKPKVSSNRRATLLEQKYKAMLEEKKTRGDLFVQSDNIRVQIQSHKFILDEESILKHFGSEQVQFVRMMKSLDRELYYIVSDGERERFLEMSNEEKEQIKRLTEPHRDALLAAIATKGEILSDAETESIIALKESEKSTIVNMWGAQYQRTRKSIMVSSPSSCYIPPKRAKEYGFHMPRIWDKFMRKKESIKTPSLPLEEMQALILEIYEAKDGSSHSLAHFTIDFFKEKHYAAVFQLKLVQFIRTLREHYLEDTWCNQFARFCRILNSLPTTCFSFYLGAFESLPQKMNRSVKKYRFPVQHQVRPLDFRHAAAAIRGICSELEIDVGPWIKSMNEKKTMGTIRSKKDNPHSPIRLAIIDIPQFTEIIIDIWKLTLKRRETDLRILYVRFDEYHSNALTFQDFEVLIRSYSRPELYSPTKDEL